MFFLQETLLTHFNANELDVLTYKNTVACFTPATPGTSPNSGRPAGSLVMFQKTSDTDNFPPMLFTNRIMGMNVQKMSHSFAMLNVYLCCDDSFLFSLY